MDRKKKIFVGVAIAFVLLMIFITIDIFSRTSPPGKKKHLPNQVLPGY